MAHAAKHPSAERTASVERQVSSENSADSPLVQHLRRQVATAFVLYLNYKHYHWQTYGPLFRDLHKLFDEFADEVLATIDPFAERIRMIGQDPPAHASAMADLAGVAPAAPHSTMREMMEEARRNLLEVIKDMRDGARLADERDDPGTVDLYSRVVQVHEKHEWWVRDILRTDDGLCK
jgi:starvation-inducible DNA-binding protein